MLTVPGADGCDQLVDDGGDATLLMHKGTELEAAFAKDGLCQIQRAPQTQSLSASCSW